ncbi:MAG: hypothetical protein R2794_05010 [Chitinophagales bacterium]
MKITKHPVLPEETISSYTIRFTLPRKDDSSEYFYRTVVLDKTASIDSLTESLRDAKKADLRYIGNYTAVQIIGTYGEKHLCFDCYMHPVGTVYFHQMACNSRFFQRNMGEFSSETLHAFLKPYLHAFLLEEMEPVRDVYPNTDAIQALPDSI